MPWSPPYVRCILYSFLIESDQINHRSTPADFVRYNSLVICAIPGFLALSTGLAGTALFIGLDRSTGSPVSYIGLAGTAVGGLLVGSATVRGMVGTYRLLTPLVGKKI